MNNGGNWPLGARIATIDDSPSSLNPVILANNTLTSKPNQSMSTFAAMRVDVPVVSKNLPRKKSTMTSIEPDSNQPIQSAKPIKPVSWIEPNDR